MAKQDPLAGKAQSNRNSDLWEEPKIDWNASDYINTEDFIRIWNNQRALQQMIREELHVPVAVNHFGLDSETEFPYIENLNQLEQNLGNLCDGLGFIPFDGEIVTWTLSKGPSFIDLNRWENIILGIKENIKSVKQDTLCCGTFYLEDDYDAQLYTGIV